MTAQFLFLLPVLAPLALAAALPLLNGHRKAVAALPLAAAVVSGLAFLAAVFHIPLSISYYWVGPFTLEFALDSWRAVLLAAIVIFELMTGLYALSALPRQGRPTLLTAALLLAFTSACGVVLTKNVLLLLVFWETFLVALYGAILSGGAYAERVAQKALIIGGASDFLMILGLMLYLKLGGSATLGTPLPLGDSFTALVSFVLIFLGAGAKAGMFPFHTWIPEAAEVMPVAGFAALPASLEKVLGISFLFTVTHRMFELSPIARTIMLAFAVATVFVVIFPALVEQNLKKVLAFTAISPVGFMIAGMATSEAAGMIGGLMYMLTHATYKSGMFFAAGIFEERAGSARLSDLHGIGRMVPAAGWGFVLAFLAAISLPPTGGFLAKELIFEGLLAQGSGWVFALLWIGAILNMAVFCKLVAVLMGHREGAAPAQAPAPELLVVVVLGALAVLTGSLFTAAGGAFASQFAHPVAHLLSAPWHVGPLTLASLLLYILGFMLYLGARSRVERADSTFARLAESPVLGRGLALAAEKKFDAYEIGLRMVEFITRIIFRYVERLIDVTADGLIGIGGWFARHFLSAVHSGLYSTYLAWTIIGLIIVISLIYG